MKLSDFDYYLPKELIAQEPANPRTHSRLMVLKEGRIEHKKFYEIVDYFQKGDVLVVNETKVMKVKIRGRKESGGRVELMLEREWAVVKGRVKEGDVLFFNEGIEGRVLKKEGNRVKVEFSHPIDLIIERIGELPLPPYIKKPLERDSQYQTTFARREGSLACPTAGLHFDEDLIEKIKNKGVRIAKVCLHVSWDTFLPVKEEDVERHEMHGELCGVDEENAKVINEAKRLFVVGTTSLRALESFAENGRVRAGKKVTKIFIYPGYEWKLKYSGLITNFHLPKSTLLMMISAFYGRERILEAYRIAVKEKYRFYSLGDAMLIFNDKVLGGI